MIFEYNDSSSDWEYLVLLCCLDTRHVTRDPGSDVGLLTPQLLRAEPWPGLRRHQHSVTVAARMRTKNCIALVKFALEKYLTVRDRQKLHHCSALHWYAFSN